jgi:hypothetical protein
LELTKVILAFDGLERWRFLRRKRFEDFLFIGHLHRGGGEEKKRSVGLFPDSNMRFFLE